MSLKKQFLKSGSICKVTFRLPREAAGEAKTVHVVGEFNNWDVYATPMKCLKNGSFTVTINLEQGREYQFRYLIDETSWENDWDADKYLPSHFGNCENSVVVV
ncbi:MAG: glycoside hydrolase [Planctomycetaceae bacterium]|nr:MAG: glycoside hydrolase [Planctomycetaceae bacterium]